MQMPKGREASALHPLRAFRQRALERRPMKGLLFSSAGIVDSFRIIIPRPFRGAYPSGPEQRMGKQWSSPISTIP
jgi:hypothetical protein